MNLLIYDKRSLALTGPLVQHPSQLCLTESKVGEFLCLPTHVDFVQETLPLVETEVMNIVLPITNTQSLRPVTVSARSNAFGQSETPPKITFRTSKNPCYYTRCMWPRKTSFWFNGTEMCNLEQKTYPTGLNHEHQASGLLQVVSIISTPLNCGLWKTILVVQLKMTIQSLARETASS